MTISAVRRRTIIAETPSISFWSFLRIRPISRRIRLVTGGILFTYVTTHLANHALGNASVQAMETGLLAQKWVWQSAVGTVLLYSSLLVHGTLGLVALYKRRHVGWSRFEIVQMGLGLALPLLLATHAMVTRGALSMYGLDKGYAVELVALGVSSLFFGGVQLVALVAAWAHGCMGLSFSLRLRPWYKRRKPMLVAAVVLLPVVAMLGFVQGVREINRNLADPSWSARILPVSVVGTAEQIVRQAKLRNAFILFYVALIALVFAARVLRHWEETKRRGITISYPDGRTARLPETMSILDASRLIGYRHASVCGGRGRCSTCRIRILTASASLPPASAAESAVLKAIRADPEWIRLACQLRPRIDLEVIPLVPPELAERYVLGRSGNGLGEERFVVAMFVDLRGSTKLAETRLPFDAVFIVRRFIDIASAAVIDAGGAPNQFTGDGFLALFGLRSDPATACRQALRATYAIGRAVADMNAALSHDLAEPLRFGVGVHCGQAVVGEIGFREHATFTALGDVVNVAARLQAATRESGCDAAISEAVVAQAGPEWASQRQVTLGVRGRSEPLITHLLILGYDRSPLPPPAGWIAAWKPRRRTLEQRE